MTMPGGISLLRALAWGSLGSTQQYIVSFSSEMNDDWRAAVLKTLSLPTRLRFTSTSCSPLTQSTEKYAIRSWRWTPLRLSRLPCSMSNESMSSLVVTHSVRRSLEMRLSDMTSCWIVSMPASCRSAVRLCTTLGSLSTRVTATHMRAIISSTMSSPFSPGPCFEQMGRTFQSRIELHHALSPSAAVGLGVSSSMGRPSEPMPEGCVFLSRSSQAALWAAAKTS
mmetsp:Transcript_18682/g.49361  ORF Transcript_18682/g.49361 Transcript_18682/m.49361 type:complete len:224 (+) Transcript_18682:635-1306(+)